MIIRKINQEINKSEKITYLYRIDISIQKYLIIISILFVNKTEYLKY